MTGLWTDLMMMKDKFVTSECSIIIQDDINFLNEYAELKFHPFLAASETKHFILNVARGVSVM